MTTALKTLRRAIISTSILALLPACANYHAAQSSATDATMHADAALDIRKEAHGPNLPDNIRKHPGIWLGDTGIKSRHGEPLPEKWLSPKAITLVSAQPVTLPDIAALIADASSIQMVGATEIGKNLAIADRRSIGQLQNGPAVPTQAPIWASANADPLSARSDTMSLNYQGSLDGLMDLVSAQFGADWEYRNGTLHIFDSQTKTFLVKLPDTDTDIRTNIESEITGIQDTGTSGSGGGNGGDKNSTTQGVTIHTKINAWEKLGETMKQLVPPNVGTYVLSSYDRTVTVTASRDTLDKVESYLKGLNGRVARQVGIHVDVYNVTVDDSDTLALNVSGLLSAGPGGQLSSGFGLVTNGLTAAGTTPGSFNLGVIAPTAGQTYHNLNGSKIAVQALSQHGRVSFVNSGDVTARNYQPAPLSIQNQQSYIVSAATSQGNVSTQTQVQQALIKTGFSFNFVPEIYANGRVDLGFNLSLSDLNSIASQTVGTTLVQQPNVDTRSTYQTVRMHSNETLVLTGYERTTSTTSQQGVGDSAWWPFGGGIAGEKKRDILVILLTPVIIEDDAQIQSRG